MEGITACFGSERMNQKRARTGIAGNNVLENVLKIALGLLISPIRGTWRQLLEVKASVVFRMAAVTAGVPRPLLQENGLHPGFEELKIQGDSCGRGSRLRR